MAEKTDRLTHIDSDGTANMVDVAAKPATTRIARVEGAVLMQPETLQMILRGDAKKGDVIGTARLAGIMAAKRTADLIPLCHPLSLTKVEVNIEADETLPGLSIVGMAKCIGQTGVEMEALTAVSVACLTVYDMAKAVDRSMTITNIRLVEKTGGASGDFKSC